MNIFYTASFYGKERYQKYYDMVREAIEVTKVKLVSPEKGNYLSLVPKTEQKRISDPRKIHYEAVRRGITAADGVIIEISQEDFQLGHEATLAIQNKKPVLCLSVYEDFAEKITNPYLFGAKYNEYTVSEIVEEFIKRVEKRRFTERFNLFLSPTQVSYLEKSGKAYDMNMSEYLRRLIDQDRDR
jgi:hypothetical protein